MAPDEGPVVTRIMASIVSAARQGKKVITCFVDALLTCKRQPCQGFPFGGMTRGLTCESIGRWIAVQRCETIWCPRESYPTSGFVAEGIAFEKPVVQCVTGKDAVSWLRNTLRTKVLLTCRMSLLMSHPHKDLYRHDWCVGRAHNLATRQTQSCLPSTCRVAQNF